jgi:hypothetical protein
MAVDSAGNLYVATSESPYDIDKITPNGLVSTFTAMDSPSFGLAFDQNGYLYAAVRSDAGGTNEIVKIAPNGEQQVFVSSSQFLPAGLAFDSNGNLLVADYWTEGFPPHGAIDEITPNGDITRHDINVNVPWGIAVANGTIYVTGRINTNTVTNNGAVFKISDTWNATVYNDDFCMPMDVTSDVVGNLYVLDDFVESGYGAVIYEIDASNTTKALAQIPEQSSFIIYIPEPRSPIILLFVAMQRRRLRNRPYIHG